MGKKREGHIYKRGKTFWLEYWVNGRRHRQSLQTTDPDDAERARERIMAPLTLRDRENQITAIQDSLAGAREQTSSAERKSNSPTLDGAWTAYMRSARRPTCSDSTLDAYQRQWNAFVNWAGRRIERLDEISPEIAEAYSHHLSRHRSANTHNKHVGVCSRVFRGLLPADPDPWKAVPRKRLSTSSWRELTRAEVDGLLAGSAGEMGTLFHLGVYTGMRLSDCVHIDASQISVDRQIIRATPRKTARLGRHIILPIHPKLLDHLKALSVTHGALLPELHTAYRGNGKPAVSRQIRKAMSDSGVDVNRGKVGFHSLRHTFVSMCAEAGIQLAVVQAIVGHGSPAMTRHYTHLGTEHLQDEIAKLRVTQKDMPSRVDDLSVRVAAAINLLSAEDLTPRERAILALLTPPE